MERMLAGWAACPKCGGELADADDGVTCQSCATHYGRRDGLLDLVDATQKVSSEGPGDTLAMAWRRRRWDELRGADAPENAAYLAAIWERLRPDDRVLDLGCGPGSFLGWMAEFAPDLAILGIDLSWDALEEARRVVGQRPNVTLARASTRRRLPVKDGSCDVILRRLAPGLPEEIVRALAPGGYYLRFTFGPNHWREVYDLAPGLPRAREDTLVGEAERMRQLGLEVEEPIRESGTEEVSLPAVLLALRSNPAAFHAAREDLRPLRQLWRQGDGGRAVRATLTTDYAILIARSRAVFVAPVPSPVVPAAVAAGDAAAQTAAEPTPRRRARRAADGAPTAEPAITTEPLDAAASDAAAAPAEAAAPPRPRARRAKGAEPAVDAAPAAASEAATPPEAEAPASDVPAAADRAPAAASATDEAAAKPRRTRKRAEPEVAAAPIEQSDSGAEAAKPRTRSRRKPAEDAPASDVPADASPARGRRKRAPDAEPAAEPPEDEQPKPRRTRKRASDDGAS